MFISIEKKMLTLLTTDPIAILAQRQLISIFPKITQDLFECHLQYRHKIIEFSFY